MSADKADAYSLDPYFREGWETLSTALRDDDAVRRFTWNTVTLVVRPDAIAAGRGATLLDRLEAEGLLAVAAIELTFDRRLVRELWRYQLNVATSERIEMMDLVLIGRPALLVLFAEADPAPSVPACVRLRAVKGPSAPDRRADGQLRASLSAARASVLTMIHTPDEPIDLVRDLAVLLDPAATTALLADGRRDTRIDDEVLEALERLRLTVGAHDLGLARATAAVGREAAGRRPDETLTAYVERLTGVNGATRWDALVVAAHVAATHYPGECALPDTDSEEWLR